jgi:hypothetical protein
MNEQRPENLEKVSKEKSQVSDGAVREGHEGRQNLLASQKLETEKQKAGGESGRTREIDHLGFSSGQFPDQESVLKLLASKDYTQAGTLIREQLDQAAQGSQNPTDKLEQQKLYLEDLSIELRKGWAWDKSNQTLTFDLKQAAYPQDGVISVAVANTNMADWLLKNFGDRLQQHAARLESVPTPDKPPEKVEAKDHAEAKVADPKWEAEKKKLAKEHGLEVEEHDGKLEFHLRGHKEALVTVDATEKGLHDADKEIKKLIHAKEAELSKKYGAKFSQDGETAGKEWVMVNGHWQHGPNDIKCRAPRIDELYGIEAALAHSQPSAHGVKFYITVNELFKHLGDAADYYPVPPGGSDKTTKPGSPAVFINSKYTDNLQPDELPEHPPHYDRNRPPFTIQYAISHELAHHSEHQMGWDDENPTGNKFGEKEATAMGWVSPVPHTSNTDNWLLEDHQGGLWKHEKFGSNQWVRCDKTGHPIDAHGHQVPINAAEHQSMEEMKRDARITPYNDYFDKPKEMYAEAIACFRTGGIDRAALALRNPSLYKVINAGDQEEIDKAHPPKGSQIRDVDGNVVPDSEDVRKKLRPFEPPEPPPPHKPPPFHPHLPSS